MPLKSEVLFVDPEVDDIDHVLAGVRPEVEAVVLDRHTSPARQIAATLAGRHELAAVHVMAHGAPGRVDFSAGGWSAASLERDVADLAAIGAALGARGELRLWSCDTAAGQAGAAFVEALAQCAGAAVAASVARVGAADKGGSWELSARAERPARHLPLTAQGAAKFAGVLAPIRIKVSGPIPEGETANLVTFFVVDRAGQRLGRFTLPNASRRMRAFRLIVNLVRPAEAYDVGVFDDEGQFVSAGFTLAAAARPGAAGAVA